MENPDQLQYATRLASAMSPGGLGDDIRTTINGLVERVRRAEGVDADKAVKDQGGNPWTVDLAERHAREQILVRAMQASGVDGTNRFEDVAAVGGKTLAPWEQALERNLTWLARMDSIVSALEEKLEPIRVPLPEWPDENATDAYMTEIARRIAGQTEELIRLCGRLERLCATIEV